MNGTYAAVNNFISEGSVALVDLAFPNHDGKADAEAIATLMLLRQELNSLARACGYAIGSLTEVIDLYEVSD